MSPIIQQFCCVEAGSIALPFLHSKDDRARIKTRSSFARLPETLIKARIIRGWTQEQLAERLGVKAQQVQRDEANLYAGASFTKLLETLRALDIEVRGEVIFR